MKDILSTSINNNFHVFKDNFLGAIIFRKQLIALKLLIWGKKDKKILVFLEIEGNIVINPKKEKPIL